MKILFWNIKGNSIPGLIGELTAQFQIDILALAENDIPIVTLLKSVNEKSNDLAVYTAPNNPSDRITLLSRLPANSIKPMSDEAGVTIRNVIPPIGLGIILVVAHLPSKLHKTEIDQTFFSTRIAREIEECEKRAGHNRTVLVGDLNMNPFEPGVSGADAFHAVMSRSIAVKGSRTVDKQERRFFYNPMWNRMGDHSKGPPGTFYYGSGGQVCHFWNTFDQVLIRPDLLNNFDDNDLNVITKIGALNLLNNKNLPDSAVASDHLPIVFKLNL